MAPHPTPEGSGGTPAVVHDWETAFHSRITLSPSLMSASMNFRFAELNWLRHPAEQNRLA